MRELEHLDEMLLFEFESPVTILSEWADTKHMVKTLEEYLSKLTVTKLRALLQSRGVSDIPRRLKKDALVELAHETLTSDIKWLLAPLIAWGPSYIDYLCMLLEAGGAKSFWKGDITSPYDVPSGNVPTLILVDERLHFIVVAPQEVEDAVFGASEQELHEIRELSQACSDVRVIGAIMADLCGLVSVDEVLEYCFGPLPVPIPDDMLEYLLANVPLIESENMHVVSDGTRRYFASFDLLDVFCGNEEGDLIDPSVADALLAARARIKRHPLDDLIDGRRTNQTVNSRALLSPEGRAFIGLIDDHIPNSMGSGAIYYSFDVLEDILRHLRVSDDVSAIVDGVFAKDRLLVQGNLAERILDAAEAINYRIPKWRLNGWSLAEIDELRTKGTLSEVCAAPDDLCGQSMAQRDRSKDEVSGYLYIESEEEAAQIAAESQGKRLLGLI